MVDHNFEIPDDDIGLIEMMLESSKEAMEKGDFDDAVDYVIAVLAVRPELISAQLLIIEIGAEILNKLRAPGGKKFSHEVVELYWSWKEKSENHKELMSDSKLFSEINMKYDGETNFQELNKDIVTLSRLFASGNAHTIFYSVNSSPGEKEDYWVNRLIGRLWMGI